LKKFDLGQSLQLLGNLGVIVGILLLVYELAQNREMTRAQTRNSVAEMLVNLLGAEFGDQEIAGLQVKRSAGQSLTPVEGYRFEMLQEAYWRYRENVHYQYRNGLYDEDEYLALREVWLRDVDTDELRRAIYCGRRNASPSAFIAEIDAVMERPCD
jgi:hypothetical protein